MLTDGFCEPIRVPENFLSALWHCCLDTTDACDQKTELSDFQGETNLWDKTPLDIGTNNRLIPQSTEINISEFPDGPLLPPHVLNLNRFADWLENRGASSDDKTLVAVFFNPSIA